MAKKKPPHSTKKAAPTAKRRRRKATSFSRVWFPSAIFQLKITLLDTQPPVWRRIQVRDCTLSQLHDHIQAAMGWGDEHLHQFKIGELLFGDPALMEDSFDDTNYADSTAIRLSHLLLLFGETLRFTYEYDFGDSWMHEIVFESLLELQVGHEYPVCLEGERALPAGRHRRRVGLCRLRRGHCRQKASSPRRVLGVGRRRV